MSENCKAAGSVAIEKSFNDLCVMESELEKVSLLAYLTIKIILDWTIKIIEP